MTLDHDQQKTTVAELADVSHLPEYRYTPPPFRITVLVDKSADGKKGATTYETLPGVDAWFDSLGASHLIEAITEKSLLKDSLPDNVLVEEVAIEDVTSIHGRAADVILVPAPYSYKAIGAVAGLAQDTFNRNTRAASAVRVALFHFGNGTTYCPKRASSYLLNYDVVIVPDDDTRCKLQSEPAMADTLVKTVHTMHGHWNPISAESLWVHDTRGGDFPLAGKDVTLVWAEGLAHPALPFLFMCLRSLQRARRGDSAATDSILDVAPASIKLYVVHYGNEETPIAQAAFDRANTVLDADNATISVSAVLIPYKELTGSPRGIRSYTTDNPPIVVTIDDDAFGEPHASFRVVERWRFRLLSQGCNVSGDAWNTTFVVQQLPASYYSPDGLGWAHITPEDAHTFLFECPSQNQAGDAKAKGFRIPQMRNFLTLLMRVYDIAARRRKKFSSR